jgi:hypothetical protein
LGVTLEKHVGNQEFIMTIVFRGTTLSCEKVENRNWNFEMTQEKIDAK